MLILKVVMDPLHKDLLPTHAYVGDAGWDVYNAEPVRIEVGEHVLLRTGIVQMELPRDYWGLMHGRSSTRRSHGLAVRTSVVDSGYRGELLIGAECAGTEPCLLVGGERIAQLIPMPLVRIGVIPVQAKELSPSDRGTNGWGSSGL
jgi:dUTP pyrophosphatase